MPYPRTVQECLRDRYPYKRGVIAAMKEFRDMKPWKGSVPARAGKFRWVVSALADVYGIATPRVRFESIRLPAPAGASASSGYDRRRNIITMRLKMSVISVLHEFAHALRKGERGACVWSLNLFRRIFPEKWRRLTAAGHMLILDE